MIQEDETFWYLERCGKVYRILCATPRRMTDGYLRLSGIFFYEDFECGSKSEAIMHFMIAKPNERLYEVVDGCLPHSHYASSILAFRNMFNEVKL